MVIAKGFDRLATNWSEMDGLCAKGLMLMIFHQNGPAAVIEPGPGVCVGTVVRQLWKGFGVWEVDHTEEYTFVCPSKERALAVYSKTQGLGGKFVEAMAMMEVITTIKCEGRA